MIELSRRRLIATYIVALAVIAGLSLASHVMLDRALGEQRGSANLINLSGRQRMLSQRVASFAAQYALGNRAARKDLTATIDTLERNHRTLLARTARGHPGTAALDPELDALYFRSDRPLDAEVRAYVANARRIAALPPQQLVRSAQLAALFAAAREPLLADLDAVVSVHERRSDAQVSFLETIQTSMLGLVLATLLFEALYIFQPMIRRIFSYAEELLSLATIDPLTGVLNRRSLLDRARIEIERARRTQRPLAVFMIDGDRFKAINDTYGHDGGDAVLVALTATLQRALRTTDVLGRIGGEEFVVLLPETETPAAELIADRIRADVGDLQVQTLRGVASITISVGVARLAHGEDLAAMLRAADDAMYAAKNGGRNRVVVAPG